MQADVFFLLLIKRVPIGESLIAFVDGRATWPAGKAWRCNIAVLGVFFDVSRKQASRTSDKVAATLSLAK